MTFARHVTTLILAAAATGSLPGTGRAQAAMTYVVRDAQRGVAWTGAAGAAAIDLSGDRNPMRVTQGNTLTWVVPLDADETPTPRTAVVLHHNVPVRPETGGLMVRGWPSDRAARYDTFDLELARGAHDREVAGRTARHYEVRAVVARTGPDGGMGRFDYAAHLWVLPDLPHSWAPFGFGARSVTGLLPRLRDELGDRLSDLGLVAGAVIRIRYAQEGKPPVERVRAFEVSNLELAEPPPGVGPVIDRAVLDRLDRRTLEEPGAVCPAVARGELPPGAPELAGDAAAAVRGRIADRCTSPELYFGVLEDRLRSDPAALCARVRAAAVFPRAQRSAFLEFLTEADRRTFHGELRQYCTKHSTASP